MLFKKILLTISTSFAMVFGVIAIVIACGGSPTPPACPQSIFLSKFADDVELIPEDGSDFEVEIGIFPFVSWDDFTQGCADPTSAMLTVDLECTETATGATFPLGPVVFPLPTPTTPGAQPAGGTTVDFPIPGGTPPSTCDVVAAYEVTFGGGIGTSPLIGVGDLQICLVEPAPADPNLPRLDMSIIDLNELPGRDGTPGTHTFHAGDQEYIYIRIDNNDLENRLEIDLKSIGQQMALFPVGFDNDVDAYNAGVQALANDGDTYPAAFFFDDAPLPFDPLPGGPGDLGEGRIETSVVVPAGGSTIRGVRIKSFGACADGSCNERNLCGIGTFFDSDDNEVAKDPACVQFNYVVQNGEPRYPGITYDDLIKVGPDVDTQWGPVEFFDGNDLIDNTHNGNLLPGQKLPPLQDHPAIQLTGDNLRDQAIPFPGTWADQIVLPTRPDQLFFQSFFFYEQDGFQQRASRVVLNGLDELQGPCEFPTITLNRPINPVQNILDIVADVSNGCDDNTPVVLFEGGQQVLQGTIGQLKEDPNIRVDPLTCRTIDPIIDVLDRLFMVADPPFVDHNFEPDAEDALQRQIRILSQTLQEIDYRVRYVPIGAGGGVAIVGATGRGLSPIFLDPNALDPADPFAEISGYLIYENDAAVNSPLAVPVLARRLPPPPQLLPMVMFELHGPPVIRAGDAYPLHLRVPEPPQPGATIEDLEFLIQLDNPDPLRFFLPPSSPFTLTPIDGSTSQDELDRLEEFFTDGFESGDCTSGVLGCASFKVGNVGTFPLDAQIFTDGFESGDISSWSVGARGSNTEKALGKTGDVQVFFEELPFAVLNADGKAPANTTEELRAVMELFNADEDEDVPVDEKIIGLVTDRFGIEAPLPLIRGRYFFDEFESFRKSASSHPILDGSRCPPPCNGLVFEADGGGVSNIRFENFPSAGIEIRCDSLWIASNEFSGNAQAGLLISGNNNFVADSLVRANRFETNGRAGIVVERGTGNRLRYNAFTDPGTPFIDLGADGRTPNDDGDRDAGANNLQNFPVLTSVLTGGSTTIQGTLNSTPDAEVSLHFYAWSDTLLRFLGETTVRTDANGDARIDVVVEGTAEIGQEVYATATGPDGSTSEFSAPFVVVSGVATEGTNELPETYALEQNYPNPFNPQTTIAYAVPQAGAVRLEVFDLLGRLVAVLVDEKKAAGFHTVVFDAAELSSGVYLYQMTGEGFTQTKTLLLVK